MTIPNWYELVLLSLAAFRTWRLLAEDVVLDKPRAWFVYGFRKWKGNKTAQYVDDFLACPWCLGFWTGLVWWGAFELWPHGTTVATVPLVISAAVGLLGHLISD